MISERWEKDVLGLLATSIEINRSYSLSRDIRIKDFEECDTFNDYLEARSKVANIRDDQFRNFKRDFVAGILALSIKERVKILKHYEPSLGNTLLADDIKTYISYLEKKGNIKPEGSVKQHRNSKCNCGSGLKFKNCCNK